MRTVGAATSLVELQATRRPRRPDVARGYRYPFAHCRAPEGLDSRAAAAIIGDLSHSTRMRTVVVINQDQMGHGDRDLGRKILGTFLRKAVALHGLDAIVLFNSGVKLLAKDSPVLAEFTLLAERGIDVVPCGTCVQHFGMEVAVGKVSDMDAIVRELAAAEKVITL